MRYFKSSFVQFNTWYDVECYNGSISQKYAVCNNVKQSFKVGLQNSTQSFDSDVQSLKLPRNYGIVKNKLDIVVKNTNT